MAKYGSLTPFLPWRARTLPLQWEQEFARVAPLVVEIGFGNGDYLARTAKAQPEVNFVGIELCWGSVWRCLRSLEKARLTNVRLLLEDAKAALLWNFPACSVQEFTALFPCPWPKERHAKYRLFRPEFMRLMNSRLTEQGSITIVTDDESYRDQILEECTEKTTGLKSSLEIVGAEFRTKYERKWQEQGQSDFFRLSFVKSQHQTIPEPEMIDVKHHLVPDFDPKRFSLESERKPHPIEFKSFLYDPEQHIAMQEVFCREADLDQQFWVRLKKGSRGWTIAPVAGPPLLPLASVQRALDLIKEAAQNSTA